MDMAKYDEFIRRKDYQEWIENTAYKKNEARRKAEKEVKNK